MTGFVIAEKVFEDLMNEYVDKEEKKEEEVKFDNQKEYIHSKICNYIHNLYKEKNSDYGDSYSKVRAKYPEAICVRLNDKLSRLEQLMKQGYEQRVKDEHLEDTLIDIANYAIIELVEMLTEVKENGENK